MSKVFFPFSLGFLIFCFIVVLSIPKNHSVEKFSFWKQKNAFIHNAKKVKPNPFLDDENVDVIEIMNININTMSIHEIIFYEAKKAGINPIVIESIVEQESNFNPKALRYEKKWELKYGSKFKINPGESLKTWRMNFHSIGLMQIGYGLHKEFCDLKSYKDLEDPRTNIICGIKIISKCVEKNKLSTCIKSFNGSGPMADRYRNEVFVKINKRLNESNEST